MEVIILEHVGSYHYLGVLVSSKLSWSIKFVLRLECLLVCCTGSFIAGLIQTLFSFTAHVYDLTWNMPANYGILIQLSNH